MEIEVKKLTEKLNRSNAITKDKANQIKKLKSMVGHYQKQANKLRDIISNMKEQEFITNEAEEALNVRYY